MVVESANFANLNQLKKQKTRNRKLRIMNTQARSNIESFNAELKALRELVHEQCEPEIANQLKLKLGKANRVIVNLLDEIDMAKDHENELAKKALYRIGKEINEETRLTKNAKSFAVAIVLNELGDIENNHPST